MVITTRTCLSRSKIICTQTKNSVCDSLFCNFLTGQKLAPPPFVNSKYATAVQSLSLQIREGWQPPERALIHWDGKLMESFDGKSSENRLPTLISGVGGFKLLGTTM